MEFFQTYETTIASPEVDLSATFFVIPARSFHVTRLDDEYAFEWVAKQVFDAEIEKSVFLPHIDPDEFLVRCLTDGPDPEAGDGDHSSPEPPDTAGGPPRRGASARVQFASYVLNARVIPFENSPLGAESLASIATSSVRAGTVTLGATIGFIAAGQSPMLLVTVPLGIVLCGASVSFAKYMEENRKTIWNKLIHERYAPPKRHIRKVKFDDGV